MKIYDYTRNIELLSVKKRQNNIVSDWNFGEIPDVKQLTKIPRVDAKQNYLSPLRLLQNVKYYRFPNSFFAMNMVISISEHPVQTPQKSSRIS